MSKILDRVTGAIRGPGTSGPKAPQIEPRLRAAEARLAELDAQHGVLALADVMAEPGAKDNLDHWAQEIDAQRVDVRRLRAAYRAAKEADDEAERSARASIRQSQIFACVKYLRDRDAAAVELSAALGTAMAAFRRLVERSERAQAATPIGSIWPLGAQTHFGELKHLVEAEIFRLGGDPGIGNKRSFPGATCPDIRLLNQPEKVPALPDVLSAASAYVIATLKGERPATEAPTPAVPTSDDPRAPAAQPEEHQLGASEPVADAPRVDAPVPKVRLA